MTVSYADLGASLYVPATHPSLESVFIENRYQARSVIACTEDAISEREVGSAIRRLQNAAATSAWDESTLRFVRPRHAFALKQMLDSQGLRDRLDGFVIPKFDAERSAHWMEVLHESPEVAVMPTLETKAIFTESGCLATLEALNALQNPVVCLRIGLNDLLGCIGLKRQAQQTSYDTPIRATIERIVTIFRSAGYEISAPVFDRFRDLETLGRELECDMAWGFYAKSCIHPAQLPVIEQAFHKSLEEQRLAANALDGSSNAVFQHEGQMLEATCHGAWARRTYQLLQSRKTAQGVPE